MDQCQGCEDGYRLDAAANLCEACADPNCVTCEDGAAFCTGKAPGGASRQGPRCGLQTGASVQLSVQFGSCRDGRVSGEGRAAGSEGRRCCTAPRTPAGCLPGYGLVLNECKRCDTADSGCVTWQVAQWRAHRRAALRLLETHALGQPSRAAPSGGSSSQPAAFVLPLQR